MTDTTAGAGKALSEMNRDELRKLAAELKIKGRGTMLRADLEQAIAETRAAQIKENVNAKLSEYVVSETKSTGSIPDRVIDAQLSAYAFAEPTYLEDGKGGTTELSRLSERAAVMEYAATRPYMERMERARTVPLPGKVTRKQLQRAGRRGERGLVNGEPMPLHHRGRAVGAKYFLDRAPQAEPFERQTRPLGYDARENNYSKQGGVRFTPKQERRLAHKSNHHVAVMADPK